MGDDSSMEWTSQCQLPQCQLPTSQGDRMWLFGTSQSPVALAGPPDSSLNYGPSVVAFGQSEQGILTENVGSVRRMLGDFNTPIMVDPETGSETSGISEFTGSGNGSEAFRGRFSSGPSSVTSDFEEDPLCLVQSEAKGLLKDINLRDLSLKIGDEHEKLATYLGFNTAEIAGFKVAYPTQMAERIFQMLVNWRMRTSQPQVEDLAKALTRSGRTDLAEKLRGPPDVAVHHTPNVAFKKLLVEFQDQVKTEDERAKVTYLIQQDQITGAGVPLPSEDKPMTTFQILQSLQKYNYLGPNNVWYLQYILCHLGKRDLYRRVWDYAIRRLKTHRTLHLHEPSFVKVNGHVPVKFKLAGDAKNFGGIHLEEFKQMLADNFGEEIHYINSVGVKEGCVEFFFQVRLQCADKACAAAKKKQQWLLQIGVLEVTIFGETDEVISVQELDKEKKDEHAQLTKESQLLMAILKEDKVQAELLLAEGVNPNGKLGGKSMIHWAICLDNEGFVQRLLDYKTTRDQKDDVGLTPVEQAKFLGQCLTPLTWYIMDIDLQGIIQKYCTRVRKKSGESDITALQKPYQQERRQFVCDPCSHVWKTYVSAEKPFSRCDGCHMWQKALPIKNELKRSKYMCPKCKHVFSGWEYEGIRMRCYKCQTQVVPYHGGNQNLRGDRTDCNRVARRRKSSTSTLQRYAVSNRRFLNNKEMTDINP